MLRAAEKEKVINHGLQRGKGTNKGWERNN